jgi:hypothetical protein
MMPEAILTLCWCLPTTVVRAFFGDAETNAGTTAATSPWPGRFDQGLMAWSSWPGHRTLYPPDAQLGRVEGDAVGHGNLLFLAIAAPWHIMAGMRNEHFFWFYFVNEHFLRFIGKRYPVDYNRVPFLSYWLLHLVWLFHGALAFPYSAESDPG